MSYNSKYNREEHELKNKLERIQQGKRYNTRRLRELEEAEKEIKMKLPQYKPREKDKKRTCGKCKIEMELFIIGLKRGHMCSRCKMGFIE